MALAKGWARKVCANTLAALDGRGHGRPPGNAASRAASDRTPLGRLNRGAELLPAALYLASDASADVTGATIRVDSGRVDI
ncbi:SDR family oxidoreductase [Pseudonocardia kujensis]|nr:SDR family oxidoreductase [Pseudonocardia kujensis]